MKRGVVVTGTRRADALDVALKEMNFPVWLAGGTLALDYYAMRERLAEKGLSYVESASDV